MATNRNGMIELGGLVAPSGKMIPLAFLERRAAAILPNRPDLAQEAVQEAALRLLHVAGANKVLNPQSYAAQVIRSAAFDLLREEYRQRRLQEDSEVQNKFATVLQSEAIDRWLFAVQILKAIRRGLGRRQYDVANLVYQGCTVAEIARKLKISRVTVYKDIGRIRTFIESLQPPDPPNKGGGGGVGFPPARGDPVSAFKTEVRRVAVLTEISEPKEVTRNGKNNGKDLRGGGMLHRQKRQSGVRLSSAESSAKEMLEEFKELLLQLPAFREAGPTLPSEENGTVENLEQVLDNFLRGQRRDRRPR